MTVTEPQTRAAPQPLPGLKGKSALVVGGTRGVGRAVAEKLAVSGCDVLAVWVNSAEHAAGLEEELAGAPAAVSTEQGDVRRPGELPRLARLTKERHGRLDFVVHSAASAHPMAVPAIDPAEMRADLATALVPLASAAGSAAELMPEGGRIVVISASVAQGVAPHLVSLGVAKAALESLTRFAAVELAARGITVNAVSAAKLDKGPGTVRPEALRAISARTPAGRPATPREVADAVALLCLPEAQWITGQVIPVDGGLGLLA
ncbi:SDR family oxidoreductase [Streptomyces triticirhizae]|uniref:SDR family oxidoreductase n=1 Tax=Streptomyces triticirhizae TaxID=2483353 RepID=A0A3M2LER1_9ACTN|nr:SDR family oxidoreductase [Streptomyces triticirhizae]